MTISRNDAPELRWVRVITEQVFECPLCTTRYPSYLAATRCDCEQ